MSLGGPGECDHPGCGALRRTVNHWFVAHRTSTGVHLYEWDKAPETAMKDGKHFCGLGHMMHYVSGIMTPDETDRNRESTLELKPPLTRQGTAPEQQPTEVEEKRENNGN